MFNQNWGCGQNCSNFTGGIYKRAEGRTSLVAQWLRLHASNAGGGDSIPGQELRSCRSHSVAKTQNKIKVKMILKL